MKKVELLAPAGNLEKLRYAVAYGADAVYLAGRQYGMRTASGNFDAQALPVAIAHCHLNGVKAFVTVNTLPRDDEMAALPDYLACLQECGADALIVADLGVLALAKRYAPKVPIHISTQTSVVNAESASMYHDLGASRVVLARELTLDEIATLRAKAPRSLELEAFVHGAMCVSYSGRCLLSNFMAGRDSNRGACAQLCRWQYSVVEEKRPGLYMPVEQDEHGTYIFNANDLSMIDHLPDLLNTGIDSLKIEGRVKTFYYAAVVTGAYRRALDFHAAHPCASLPQSIADEVLKVSHRPYSQGLYYGDRTQVRLDSSEYLREWEVCAVVEQCAQDGRAVLRQKNRFNLGEPLEMISPGREAVAFTLDTMMNGEGEAISAAPHPHMEVRARLPVEAPPMSLVRRENNT